ncbi:replication initiator protein A [Staphylococcus aureus]|uniref:replication initiator protein A n=1 Tax=Staphylococcus aureus TaxID=1280 RepID=UPI001D1663CF|nr:replication initiator protein A [Staphylococcus aureus]
MSIKLYNINEEYREKFYQIPKVFLQILNISSYAKMAWGILRDRLDLSIKMVGLILKQVIFIFITKMKTHKIY